MIPRIYMYTPIYYCTNDCNCLSEVYTNTATPQYINCVVGTLLSCYFSVGLHKIGTTPITESVQMIRHIIIIYYNELTVFQVYTKIVL